MADKTLRIKIEVDEASAARAKTIIRELIDEAAGLGKGFAEIQRSMGGGGAPALDFKAGPMGGTTAGLNAAPLTAGLSSTGTSSAPGQTFKVAIASTAGNMAQSVRAAKTEVQGLSQELTQAIREMTAATGTGFQALSQQLNELSKGLREVGATAKTAAQEVKGVGAAGVGGAGTGAAGVGGAAQAPGGRMYAAGIQELVVLSSAERMLQGNYERGLEAQRSKGRKTKTVQEDNLDYAEYTVEKETGSGTPWWKKDVFGGAAERFAKGGLPGMLGIASRLLPWYAVWKGADALSNAVTDKELENTVYNNQSRSWSLDRRAAIGATRIRQMEALRGGDLGLILAETSWAANKEKTKDITSTVGMTERLNALAMSLGITSYKNPLTGQTVDLLGGLKRTLWTNTKDDLLTGGMSMAASDRGLFGSLKDKAGAAWNSYWMPVDNPEKWKESFYGTPNQTPADPGKYLSTRDILWKEGVQKLVVEQAQTKAQQIEQERMTQWAAPVVNRMLGRSLSDEALANAAGISGGNIVRVKDEEGKWVNSTGIAEFKRRATKMGLSEGELAGAMAGLGQAAGRGYMGYGAKTLSAQLGGLGNAADIFGAAMAHQQQNLFSAVQGTVSGGKSRTGLDITAGGHLASILLSEMPAWDYQSSGGDIYRRFGALAYTPSIGGANTAGQEMFRAQTLATGMEGFSKTLTGGIDPAHQALTHKTASEIAGNQGWAAVSALERLGATPARMAEMALTGRIPEHFRQAGITQDMIKQMMGSSLTNLLPGLMASQIGGESGAAVARFIEAKGNVGTYVRNRAREDLKAGRSSFDIDAYTSLTSRYNQLQSQGKKAEAAKLLRQIDPLRAQLITQKDSYLAGLVVPLAERMQRSDQATVGILDTNLLTDTELLPNITGTGAHKSAGGKVFKSTRKAGAVIKSEEGKDDAKASSQLEGAGKVLYSKMNDNRDNFTSAVQGVEGDDVEQALANAVKGFDQSASLAAGYARKFADAMNGLVSSMVQVGEVTIKRAQ